jgi:hypothetical protein
VTGVITALKTGDYVGFFGIKVYYFPFTLIAPLSAYNCNIGHVLFPAF